MSNRINQRQRRYSYNTNKILDDKINDINDNYFDENSFILTQPNKPILNNNNSYDNNFIRERYNRLKDENTGLTKKLFLIEKKYKNKLAEMEGQILLLRDENSSLQLQLQKIIEKQKNLYKKNFDYNNENQFLVEKITLVKNEMDNLQEILNNQYIEINSKNQLINDLQNKENLLTNEKDKLELKIEQLSQDKEMLISQINDLDNTIGTKIKPKLEQNEENLNYLQNQIEQLTEEKNKYKNDNEILNNENKIQKNLIKVLTSRNKKLLSEIKIIYDRDISLMDNMKKIGLNTDKLNMAINERDIKELNIDTIDDYQENSVNAISSTGKKYLDKKEENYNREINNNYSSLENSTSLYKKYQEDKVIRPYKNIVNKKISSCSYFLRDNNALDKKKHHEMQMKSYDCIYHRASFDAADSIRENLELKRNYSIDKKNNFNKKKVNELMTDTKKSNKNKTQINLMLGRAPQKGNISSYVEKIRLNDILNQGESNNYSSRVNKSDIIYQNSSSKKGEENNLYYQRFNKPIKCIVTENEGNKKFKDGINGARHQLTDDKVLKITCETESSRLTDMNKMKNSKGALYSYPELNESQKDLNSDNEMISSKAKSLLSDYVEDLNVIQFKDENNI